MSTAVIYKILLSLLWFSDGWIIAVCLENMLAGNEQRSSRQKRITCWIIIFLIIGFGHSFLTQGFASFVNSTLFFASSLYMAMRHYSDRPAVKLSAAALMLFLPSMTDIIFCTVYYFIKGESVVIEYCKTSMVYFILCIANQLVGAALQAMACIIWCRAKKKQRPVRYLVFLVGFVILGISILFSGVYSVSAQNSSSLNNGVYMAVSCCLFLTSCGAILVLLNQAEKKEISKELEKIRQISSLEHLHYEAVEARREEMAEIRHDYNNVLTSVLHLLNTGSAEEAQKMLSELSIRIAATREYPFCHIPIINAVLAEKQEQCFNAGIPFYADILLPDSLPIDNLDLCSTFANLIDNALRACKKEPERENTKISLSCKVNKGYLIIKCVNPCQTAPGDKPDNTGYGHKILKNIASRYNGNFFAEYADKQFTAQLSLLVQTKNSNT